MTAAARSIDLNCDLGEGAPHDADLMPLISSANVACGGHAGDDQTIRATLALARTHGIAVGAHPGYDDRAHFGRRELDLPPAALRALVARQVSVLRAACEAAGVPMTHVKPHGALYNLAARDAAVADAVVASIRESAGAGTLLYAPPFSRLYDAARPAGLVPVAEVFADRTYQPDGRLTPRSRPDALISDADAAVAQVLRMLEEGRVRATDGTDVPITAETVCLHGDGPHAVDFAYRLRAALDSAGVLVRAPGR